jgi:septation ring formation regulator EzrA
LISESLTNKNKHITSAEILSILFIFSKLKGKIWVVESRMGSMEGSIEFIIIINNLIEEYRTKISQNKHVFHTIILTVGSKSNEKTIPFAQ